MRDGATTLTSTTGASSIDALAPIHLLAEALHRFDGAHELPDNAEQVALTETHSRLETFITMGAPNSAALKPSGQGLELQPISHPNDLYDSESAHFRFLVDGEPAQGVEVELVPAGTRYRNSQDHRTLTSDAKGEITIDWPDAARSAAERLAQPAADAAAAAAGAGAREEEPSP